MGIILDTCIFIHAERTKNKNLLNTLPVEEEVYISVVTVSELLVGVQIADTEERRLKRSAFVESIISSIPILNFNIKSARIHAELYAYLSKKGELIGAHDLIIAATALTHDYSIFTTNKREFNRIPGLKLC